MNSLLRGLGSGFGRTIGRIFAYIIIAFIAYIIIEKLGIKISDILPKINIGGLIY